MSTEIDMSGAKRKGGFRKGVTENYLAATPLPEDGEIIVQVLGSRGANLFEVALNDEEVAKKSSDHLALLPSKYRNVIWVKKKDFLIVEGGTEEDQEYMVKHILNKEQIKHIKKSNKWPDCLSVNVGGKEASTYADDYAGMDMGMDAEVDDGIEVEGMEKEV